jgi:hypothetical protein
MSKKRARKGSTSSRLIDIEYTLQAVGELVEVTASR